MKRKRLFLLVLWVISLLLFGCEKNDPPEETLFSFPEEPLPETETESLLNTMDPQDSAESEEEGSIPESLSGEDAPVTTRHTHSFKTVSLRPSDCNVSGEEIKRCACGAEELQVLPLLPHDPTAATCTEPSVCTRCGKKLSQPLFHQLSGKTCLRCQMVLEDPVYVLGQNLRFDEPASSVIEKLGTPTAYLEEGNLVSLIYAEDLLSLTVIQTDENGLWGVFTMDPKAGFFLQEKLITIATFSGVKDPDSEAYYRDVASCRVFGFRDALAGGDYYGMWMRYSECTYDYMEDERIFGSYAPQSLLSYYFVNAIRARHGLSALTWSEEASAVATEYSQAMIDGNFFGHDGSYADRLKQKGIFWTFAGENISQGYFNAFFVVDAYYNSQSHRDNILNSHFSYVGMGYRLREDPRSVYGAQIFFDK